MDSSWVYIEDKQHTNLGKTEIEVVRTIKPETEPNRLIKLTCLLIFIKMGCDFICTPIGFVIALGLIMAIFLIGYLGVKIAIYCCCLILADIKVVGLILIVLMLARAISKLPSERKDNKRTTFISKKQSN
jgi:amino acid transporter